MIDVRDITLRFGKRVLFENVNLKFTEGNCYGIIGANGSGKSTFLKVLTREIESDSGEINCEKEKRMAVLRQNHFEFNEFTVLDTVIMGHKKLYQIMVEKDRLYEKEDFSDEDGIKASELETEFSELNGWEAEAEASKLLSGLNIEEKYFQEKMKDLNDNQKVRVLLAQALFGQPDVLIMDEPTNHLDIESINWLEKFLLDFDNIIIVVSHDRHFLNQICTHIIDIDYHIMTLFSGNYDFWYQSSQLLRKQKRDSNKKKEEKIKELKDFIQRFSSNAAKSKQATSRKKILDKLVLEDLKSSTRKFPFISFKQEREAGKEILQTHQINRTINGNKILNNISFNVYKGDKIAFVGLNGIAKTTLFQILMGVIQADSGHFQWGQTIKNDYFPKENAHFFEQDLSLIDWLRQYSIEKDEAYIRGFLGRMLFSGDEALKSVRVLSGGEKVRCLLSKLMLTEANFLILDEPTNHLDLEAITALNNGLIDYKGTLLFVSQDHQFIHSIANRIIEITAQGIIDKVMQFDDYLEDEKIKQLRQQMI